VRGVCQPRPLRMRRPLARRRSAAANGGARTAIPLDLGEELLRVAAYLHGGLGANVLCAHAGVDGQRRALSVLGANALSRRSGERCAGRTLYAAPGAPVQLQRIQEPRVLVVAPALALLADDVRLARLRGRGGQLTLRCLGQAMHAGGAMLAPAQLPAGRTRRASLCASLAVRILLALIPAPRQADIRRQVRLSTQTTAPLRTRRTGRCTR